MNTWELICCINKKAVTLLSDVMELLNKDTTLSPLEVCDYLKASGLYQYSHHISPRFYNTHFEKWIQEEWMDKGNYVVSLRNYLLYSEDEECAKEVLKYILETGVLYIIVEPD